MVRIDEIDVAGRKYYYDTEHDDRYLKTEDLRICKENIDPPSTDKHVSDLSMRMRS